MKWVFECLLDVKFPCLLSTDDVGAVLPAPNQAEQTFLLK